VSESASLSNFKKTIFALILLVGAPIVAIVLLEGSASVLLFLRQYSQARSSQMAMRPHLTGDTLTGWINKRSYANADEYGRGIGLWFDRAGFRTDSVPSADDSSRGQLECVGDSYTIGYGVRQADTWCSQLAQYIPQSRSLNLGQDAFGIDQAFLLYKRDGVAAEHQVLVFAMTDLAFERLVTDSYQGRFKPVFTLVGAQLALHNVPVPEQTEAALKGASASRAFNDLRIMQALSKVPGLDRTSATERELRSKWPVVERIFSELDSIASHSGRTLVLVYLPTRRDIAPGPGDARRAQIAQFTSTQRIRYVDLTGPLRSLRKDSLDLAFITQPSRGSAPGVTGHYSRLGHAWVGRLLAQQLREVPTLRGVAPTSSTTGSRP